MRAEVLICADMARRGRRLVEAMAAAAPIPVVVRTTYRGDCELLMTYGTGHPIRRPWWQVHRRRGGRCIGWDLGYWDRLDPDAAMRCTLDTDHPPQWIRKEPGSRWAATGLALREDAGDGPIVLVGQGLKSCRVKLERPLQWELLKIGALRAAHPGREIVYRPKRATDPKPKGVRVATDTDIADVLKGAALVVCRHSNVAVDACIAGVPVVCEDGAAAALYGNDLCTPTPVTRKQRLSFLQSLAWWNWRPSEAKEAWTYLLQRIQCG